MRNRCVILVADPQMFPNRLVAGLDSRGVEVLTVFDAPWVMVELGTGAHTLIVTEPQRLPQLALLVQAVGTFHPRTTLWQYGREAPGEPLPSLEPMFPAKPEPIPAPAEWESASSAAATDEQAEEHADLASDISPAGPSAEAEHEPASEPAPVKPAADTKGKAIAVPPPPSASADDADEPLDQKQTMFANTSAAGSDSPLNETSEQQFRDMMSQVHEHVLRSPLPFMAPDDGDRESPLITPEELAMLMGPAPDDDEPAHASSRRDGQEEANA